MAQECLWSNVWGAKSFRTTISSKRTLRCPFYNDVILFMQNGDNKTMWLVCMHCNRAKWYSVCHWQVTFRQWWWWFACLWLANSGPPKGTTSDFGRNIPCTLEYRPQAFPTWCAYSISPLSSLSCTYYIQQQYPFLHPQQPHFCQM